MLDQALVGALTTGILALLSQAVGKCKCRVECKRNDDEEYCEPSFACGFLDSPLMQNDHNVKDEGEPER